MGYSELTQAVIAQMDMHIDTLGEHYRLDGDWFFDTMRDVANHGAGAGFGGFIYYQETCGFYDSNADAIWEAINEDAEDSGVTPLHFLASFNTYIDTDTSFKNALAWYALERAANEVTNA
jgi:hypothetical protein